MLEKTLSVPNLLSSSSSLPKISPAPPSSSSVSSSAPLSLDNFNFDDLVDVTEEVNSKAIVLANGQPMNRNSPVVPRSKWQLDHQVSACSLCNTAFGFFTRKVRLFYLFNLIKYVNLYLCYYLNIN